MDKTSKRGGVLIEKDLIVVFTDKSVNDNVRDYKFYCFNGMPKYCQVISNRTTKETIDFFDMDWNLQPFIGLMNSVENSVIPIKKPVNFKLMKEIAEILSYDYKFSRIDLYEINNKVYFGEITFYPFSGMGVFRPDEWNWKLGKMIDI
jgi:hypothetical protein